MKRVFTVLAAAGMAGIAMQAAAAAPAAKVKMQAAEVNDEVMFFPPDGELTWLDRTCDGFVVEAYEATHSTIRGSIVQRVDGEDGYVYLNHMASEYPVDTWTRFKKEGNTLVMEGVQAIYEEYDSDYDTDLMVYLAPMEVVINEYNVGTFVVPEDCRFVFNIEEDGTLTAADPKMLLGVCVRTLDETVEGDDVWLWKGFGDRDITMKPADGELVVFPEGLETQDWVMNDGYKDFFVQVAIDGDDFYVNGVDGALKESWIKGKIADGKVTFPSGQYLGADMEIFYYSYFCGADFFEEIDEEGQPYKVASLADSSIFAYDEEKQLLTLERGYVINSTADKLFPLYFYDDVTIGVQHRDPNAAPAAPFDLSYGFSEYEESLFFMLPNTDVNGDILHVDRLYYEIYVDGELQYFDIYDEDWNVEVTSRVPYMYDDQFDFWVYAADPRDHTVYLYNGEEAKSVSVRSIYINENGEEIYSAMAYWGDPSGADSIAADKMPVGVKWYDLQGREINGNTPGVAVKVTTFGDGSTTRTKVIKK